MEHIQIHTLGEFSLCAEGASISDAGNRSKKVWALLAFLICNRGRAIPQQKLINLIWGDEPDSDNPENALRITLHRLRTQLHGMPPFDYGFPQDPSPCNCQNQLHGSAIDPRHLRSVRDLQITAEETLR